jgi:small subunit ribosomal protein S6
MSTTGRTYETTFIVNASLDDAQVEAVIARVQETITKNGGTIKAVNKWGRKRLAYSINKRTNGFYVNVEFEAPGRFWPIWSAYQLDEIVLRNLTIVLTGSAGCTRSPAAAPVEEKPAPSTAGGRAALH